MFNTLVCVTMVTASNVTKTILQYSALQVSCLAGVVNQQLSMSLYKLIAFVLCTITELSHCLFALSNGQTVLQSTVEHP